MAVDSATQDTKQDTKQYRHRRYLLVLFALFILPIVIAWMIFGVWQPSGRVNHGELLKQAMPITELEAVNLEQQGDSLDTSLIQGIWSLVYIGVNPDCDEVCRNLLNNMRQIRLAQGKDIERLQTVLLLGQTPAADTGAWLVKEHQAMIKAVATPETIAFFQQAFPSTATDRWIYLVDPLGNLVMRYGKDVDPSGIRKDIKRLFKLSRIG